MITVQDRTKLVMHYAPGVLALLKREPCPGQNTAFSGVKMHSSCGCDPHHDIFKITGVHLLQPGEEKWCLEQCRPDLDPELMSELTKIEAEQEA